jgi:hypothetical protein
MAKDPLASTPERDFLQDTEQLLIEWLPRFCATDLERVKALYIPLLVRRRGEVLHGAPPQFGTDDELARVLANGWSLNCKELKRP